MILRIIRLISEGIGFHDDRIEVLLITIPFQKKKVSKPCNVRILTLFLNGKNRLWILTFISCIVYGVL